MKKAIRVPYFRLLPLRPKKPFSERATITATPADSDEEWLVIDWGGFRPADKKWLCRINHDSSKEQNHERR